MPSSGGDEEHEAGMRLALTWVYDTGLSLKRGPHWVTTRQIVTNRYLIICKEVQDAGCRATRMQQVGMNNPSVG